MTTLKIKLCLLLVTACTLPFASSQLAEAAGADRRGEKEQHVEVQINQAIRFGAFVPDGVGTVVIDLDGNRFSTGEVILIPNRDGQAGQCTLTIETDPQHQHIVPMVFFPPSANLANQTPGRGGAMVMTAFTYKLQRTQVGPGPKTHYTLQFGGTLLVSGGQSGGSYKGTIPIMIMNE